MGKFLDTNPRSEPWNAISNEINPIGLFTDHVVEQQQSSLSDP